MRFIKMVHYYYYASDRKGIRASHSSCENPVSAPVMSGQFKFASLCLFWSAFMFIKIKSKCSIVNYEV